MKIISINVNRFGGLKHYNYYSKTWGGLTIEKRISIAKSILDFIQNEKNAIDIAILQEVDVSTISNEFIEDFRKVGYNVLPENPCKPNSGTNFQNLTIAKSCIEIYDVHNNLMPGYVIWQESKISFEGTKIYLLNQHVTEHRTEKFKQAWDIYIPLRKDCLSIIMGDFNAATKEDRAKPRESAKDTIKENTERLKILKNNYIDKRDSNEKIEDTSHFTWYNDDDITDGRRLDYCFISKNLDTKYSCISYLDKRANELLNKDGFTDNTAVVLEINK